MKQRQLACWGWPIVGLVVASWNSLVFAAETYRADLVIYGGTSAGVVAAVQAARMEKSVILIEPTRHLGGLTTAGLGYTDTGNKAVIGGVAREFYQRVKAHYDRRESWKHQDPSEFPGYRPDDDAMWTFEPRVAEAILEKMLREVADGVRVVRQTQLDRRSGTTMRDGRIVSIRMKDGTLFVGEYFIDATYEGDLMVAAGVSYTIGRESNAKYGETLNGVQKRGNIHNHRFIVPVDPYVVPGDPSSGLLPRVHAGDPGKDGAGDRRLQAYCYRMCMTRVPENRVPFRKPEGYDERQYELLLRNFEAGDVRLPLSIRWVPNGKTDTNNMGAFSTDNIGMNYDYPEASDEEREAILREHRLYQEGLMWTLTHHPRVPEKIRNEMAQWGLAKDEFVDNDHWPHAIYVREARRMVSDYVVTELDCRRVRVVKDPVGMGSYNMDSHNVQRYVTKEGTVQNEGDVQVSPGGPYLISYRAIIPRKTECTNLLVPVCLSSSHIAYGSIRMEPVFMILGQSAATAAALALDSGKIPVQQVNYAMLRARLVADRQRLELDLNRYPPSRWLAPQSLPGVVVDDLAARFEGPWRRSSSIRPFVGAGYHALSDADVSDARAVYSARLKDGVYEVRLSWSASGNRAARLQVEIESADGVKRVTVDQRRRPKIDGLLEPLGRFRFQSDRPAEVRLLVKEAGGYVIADAVQFLPVRDAGSQKPRR